MLVLVAIVVCYFLLLNLLLSTVMDPQAFWLHEGKLFMAKREVVNCVKLWKYVGKHMELAKQDRILDPTPMGALPHEIASFPLIFSAQTQRQLLENGK